jgi:hypothetical protein
VQSVAAAVNWVYGVTILAPAVCLLLALRVVRLRKTLAMSLDRGVSGST